MNHKSWKTGFTSGIRTSSSKLLRKRQQTIEEGRHETVRLNDMNAWNHDTKLLNKFATLLVNQTSKREELGRRRRTKLAPKQILSWIIKLKKIVSSTIAVYKEVDNSLKMI